jgi:multicomponent Na+:H+ antiporter subunit F
MEEIFLSTVVIVLTLAIPYTFRAIIGPTVFDRVQALNGLGTIVPVILVLIGLVYERANMFIDIALALFLLNLFTTLLVAKYMSKEEASK